MANTTNDTTKTTAASSKYCTRCKTDLPLDFFYKNRSKPDGLDCFCKACYRELPSQQRRRPLIKKTEPTASSTQLFNRVLSQPRPQQKEATNG